MSLRKAYIVHTVTSLLRMSGSRVISESSNVLKICFAASSGGHFEQVMMLAPLMDKYSGFIVTENTGYDSLPQSIPVYELHQINRCENSFVLRMLSNSVMSLRIFWREKPDVVISTGAMATIPICVICKIARRKLIFIESFAKVQSGTQTGKFLYRLADRFYVQWPQMLRTYPNAIYCGGIY